MFSEDAEAEPADIDTINTAITDNMVCFTLPRIVFEIRITFLLLMDVCLKGLFLAFN